MIKELYKKYQQNMTSDDDFRKLSEELKPKILAIYQTIACNNQYKEEFIQDCYCKILDVASKKYFDETSNDKVINNYFSKVFMTAKREFIRDYGIYENGVRLNSFDENNIFTIVKMEDLSIERENATSEIINKIEIVLSKKDFAFLMVFISEDTKELRTVTEVANKLHLAKSTISVKFKRIKRKLREMEKFILDDE